MSAKKGSNGILDGKENEEKFLRWMDSVVDFKPYIRQGELNKSMIAREADLNRDVFYTNDDIETVHFPALIRRLEEEGVLKPRVANPVEGVPRPPRPNVANETRIKQIQEENEAVKAENRELRKQLEKFKGIDEILHTTGRLPW